MGNPELGDYSPDQKEEKGEIVPKSRLMIVENTLGMPKPGFSEDESKNMEYQGGELVVIDREEPEYYIGRGYLGLKGNFGEQKFPKSSLRELSSQEIKEESDRIINEPGIGNTRKILSPEGYIMGQNMLDLNVKSENAKITKLNN